MRVLEKRVLRGISGPMREETTGEWSGLHKEEIHDLHSSANIVIGANRGNITVRSFVICTAQKILLLG